MATIQNFAWAETELPRLLPQLQNIGVQLEILGASLGVAPAQITYWQEGAAAIAWATDALLAIRNYSTAMTNWRDAALIDKVAVKRALPQLNLPPQSPLAQQALADADFLTDFLDWADEVVVKTIKVSPNYNAQVELQLGLLTPPTPIPRDQMQPTIKSFHDGPQGLVEFNVDRQSQPQIIVTVTISDGRVFTNRLPSAKIPIELPDDRPYSFSAVAQYADKMGAVYGKTSQPITGTSDVSN